MYTTCLLARLWYVSLVPPDVVDESRIRWLTINEYNTTRITNGATKKSNTRSRKNVTLATVSACVKHTGTRFTWFATCWSLPTLATISWAMPWSVIFISRYCDTQIIGLQSTRKEKTKTYFTSSHIRFSTTELRILAKPTRSKQAEEKRQKRTKFIWYLIALQFNNSRTAQSENALRGDKLRTRCRLMR